MTSPLRPADEHARAPAAGLDPADAAAFRDVAASWVSGAAVITTAAQPAPRMAAARSGVTVSATSSPCPAPPLLLIQIDSDAEMLAAIEAGGTFAVNMLARDQEPLYLHLASRRNDELAGVPHRLTAHGVPVLDGVVGYAACRLEAMFPGVDHVVLIGQVVEFGVSDRKPPPHLSADRGAIVAHAIPASTLPAQGESMDPFPGGKHGLDPADWTAFRALGHRVLGEMVDHLAGVRDRPVWQKMPTELRGELRTGLPRAGIGAEAAYEEVRRLVLPYATGNTHPGFMGWVHGGGNAVGMLAELIAGGLNANLGGRDHAPIEVERQVVRWSAEMLGFPAGASGLLVTGTSIANFIAVLCARRAVLGEGVRRSGVGNAGLVGYASAAVHGCLPQAMDMAGLGSDALRIIPTDAEERVRLDLLAQAISEDREAGLVPFLVVGTAGSVNTGAVDDLSALATLCRTEKLWYHVDGAFGALAMLSGSLRPRLAGIERADSVAFDFHKWAQVQYDCGCIIVRDAELHRATFAQDAAYLARETRGLAGGHPWPCDFGPDLSRGFRALKAWMTLRAYGTDALGAVMDSCCAVARHLQARVEREPTLELLAPARLNIVCFRVRGQTDAQTATLVADLHEAGVAAPSTTMIAGRRAIRAAIVNHRTLAADVDALVDAVLALTKAEAAPGNRTVG